MTHDHKGPGGPGGSCICVKCDHKMDHRRGVPCQEERCPVCGAKMVREGSEHHQKILEARARKNQNQESNE